MDAETVERLEEKVEEAIGQVLAKMGRLPVQPSRRTTHLMAKAAVTVYEAAVEQRREKGG